jgi:uncharacterized membrane protein YhdT
MIATLQYMIDNHPWPDGAPIWVHLAVFIVPMMLLGCVYIRSRLVGDWQVK